MLIAASFFYVAVIAKASVFVLWIAAFPLLFPWDIFVALAARSIVACAPWSAQDCANLIA